MAVSKSVEYVSMNDILAMQDAQRATGVTWETASAVLNTALRISLSQSTHQYGWSVYQSWCRIAKTALSQHGLLALPALVIYPEFVEMYGQENLDMLVRRLEPKDLHPYLRNYDRAFYGFKWHMTAFFSDDTVVGFIDAKRDDGKVIPARQQMLWEGPTRIWEHHSIPRDSHLIMVLS